MRDKEKRLKASPARHSRLHATRQSRRPGSLRRSTITTGGDPGRWKTRGEGPLRVVRGQESSASNALSNGEDPTTGQRTALHARKPLRGLLITFGPPPGRQRWNQRRRIWSRPPPPPPSAAPPSATSPSHRPSVLAHLPEGPFLSGADRAASVSGPVNSGSRHRYGIVFQADFARGADRKSDC